MFKLSEIAKEINSMEHVFAMGGVIKGYTFSHKGVRVKYRYDDFITAVC
jgi:hypothetical protein